MKLILCRHGNTFSKGDKVVWTGHNDLPLVEEGRAQANRCADYLKSECLTPSAVYCSSLSRTKEFAEIIVQQLGLDISPQVDPRLDEVDYGDWTGLSDDEVVAKFGDRGLMGWRDHGVWPTEGNWGSTEAEVIDKVHSFLASLKGQPAPLVVSSNGILRYFLTVIPGELDRRFELGSFKVKTGNVCILEKVSDSFEVLEWNKQPQ